MPRSRYRILDPAAPHFLTCTVVGWLPLFSDPANARLVLDCLAHMQRQGRLTLFGYVILENHCHFVAQAEDLARSVSAFKSFTATSIVKRLAVDRPAVLQGLRAEKDRHRIDREHQVWQHGAHPKMIEGEAMMHQKLDYLHANPVRRGYVDDPVHWRYSSARTYAGEEGLIPVTTTW
ncbi:REP-associated tyrosine transposase [Roseospira goensis]|uniref:REP element-mobilizing transposase RayT n=1 Tax=Roseospira goensis TaxID=391922 RepID=A0A7W6S1X0_9PROT|nr:transposase [Roseospira goensis]MBB4287216.1 REP element-mobilizing transposase RayT [Roseospira goensis]